MPIPALIGAAAALGTGMMNASSQAAANSQNYKMFREQISYDRWKFLRSERYNSIQNQVNQLKAAGLNPGLMGSGLSSQISAGSSPTGHPMQAVDYSGAVNAGASLLTSFYNARQADAQRENIQSQTDLNRIDSITRLMQNLSTIKNQSADTGLKQATTDYQKRLVELAGIQTEFERKTLADRVLQQQWNTELTRAQTEAQLIANKYAEPQNQAAISLALAQVKAALATGQASIMQAKNAANEIAAKYGVSAKDREAYRREAFNYLISQTNLNRSSEYKNTVVDYLGVRVPYDKPYDNWSMKHNGYRR